MSLPRSVLHVDVNSAFLSWTALDLLEKGAELDIRTVPAVVGGDETARHGIVLAKSQPAKAYGIQTGEPLFQARRKCPNLLVVPSEYAIYSRQSNRMYALLCDYSPTIQRYSIDECFLEYTGMEEIHGSPVECAETIRRRCEAELGFTVNVGVGSNKLLAKMAGELHKPNRVNTIFSSEIKEKLWPLPVRELFMVGHATEQALRRRGVLTVGELARMDPATVRYYLKSHGMLVWGYANGIDSSPVVPNDSVAPKSFSNATTLRSDITSAAEAHKVLLPLCESVAERMRRDGFSCRQIGIQIRYSDFSSTQRQQSLTQPLSQSRALFSIACSLFDSFWNTNPVRLLGVRLSDVSTSRVEQLMLTDLCQENARKSIDSVTDHVRRKYGRRSLIPAAMLHTDFTHLERYAPDSEKPKTNSPF